MLNHTGNSYITRWKQLCHPPDTVMSHRIKLYHPLVSGSRSNFAFAKQSKLRSGILKWNKKSTSSVFHFIWLCFYFKMSHNIYYISSWATILEYLPRGDTKAQGSGALCHPIPKAGIGWHNATGLLCHLRADILVRQPRSHVIHVYV